MVVLQEGEHSSLVDTMWARFKKGPVSTQEELLTKGFSSVIHTPVRYDDEVADWNCKGTFVHVRGKDLGARAFPNGAAEVICQECGYCVGDMDTNRREYREYAERTGDDYVNLSEAEQTKLLESLRKYNARHSR